MHCVHPGPCQAGALQVRSGCDDGEDCRCRPHCSAGCAEAGVGPTPHSTLWCLWLDLSGRGTVRCREYRYRAHCKRAISGADDTGGRRQVRGDEWLGRPAALPANLLHLQGDDPQSAHARLEHGAPPAAAACVYLPLATQTRTQTCPAHRCLAPSRSIDRTAYWTSETLGWFGSLATP